MGSKKTETETTETVELENAAAKVAVVTLEDKILRQVCGDIANLLDSNWPAIYQAYRVAHIESGEEEFTFGIGLGVRLQPEMRAVKVTCKLSYAVKYADETEPVMVSNQPELFKA